MHASEPEVSDDKAVEREIGRRIRDARLKRGLTQADLARQLGITPQQTHKYERGMNRIAASRLLRIARLFEVDVSAFFPIAEVPNVPGGLDLELARNFARIPSEQHRRSVCQLVRSLVPGEDAETPPEAAVAPVRLRLFVSSSATASSSRRSLRAETTVRKLCEARLAGRYRLEVIDLHRDPAAAQQHQIVAVPTLVKLEPKPQRVLVGEMTEATLAAWLGL